MLNDLAKEIAKINKGNGFAEPLPYDIGYRATIALMEIKWIVEEFEKYIKEYKLDSENMIDINHEWYNNVKLLLVISEMIEVIDAMRDKHDEEVAGVFVHLLDHANSKNVDVDQ